MNKLFLILIIVTAISMSTVLTAPVFSASERECVRHESSEMVKIRTPGYNSMGECDWLVDKLMYNNSGFTIKQYIWSDANESCNCEVWVMTKK